MTLSRTGSHRKALWVVGLAAIAAVAASALLVVTGDAGTPANAQELRCDDDQFALLCLRKDTGGTPGTFPFDIERDVRPILGSQDISCDIERAVDDSDYTEVLGAGEEVAIPFGCAVRITERRQPGWALERIDCEYNKDYYDVQQEGPSLIILVDRTSQDSVNVNGRNDIRCTFVNRPERPNLNLGGLFAGQPTPLPTAPAPAAVAPAATSPVIRPPSTGNAGLR